MNTDFGGHRLLTIGKKDNGSLASAVAHAAKRRQATTTAVPQSAPFCGDGHPSFCTYAKLLLAAVIIGISRSARSRSRDEAYRRADSSTKHRRRSQEDEVRHLNNSWDFE